MNKYLKIVLILFFSLGILSITPSIILSKVININKIEKEKINKKFKKELNTFNINNFEKLLKEKNKNFILYIGGDFCGQCKELNEKLNKIENKKVDNIIEKFFIKTLKYDIKKDFRNTDEFVNFWKYIVNKFPYNWKKPKKSTMVNVPFFIFFKKNIDNKLIIEWMGNSNFTNLKRKAEDILDI